MRDDAFGLFWEDVQTARTRGEVIRPQPPIPDTGWRTPTDFPNLSAAKVLSFDVETYDPELSDKGPGWARGKGHIVGVSIGADTDGGWYFPIRHTIEPETNMDPETVLRWLREALGNPHQPKIGANLGYDIGWLAEEGVEVAGPLADVQLAEALLCESGKVGLDHLGLKYLGVGKETSLLYKWMADFYGGKPDDKDRRKDIWRSPPRLVAPYAIADSTMPLAIARKQLPLLQRDGLLRVLEMENGLIRLLHAMRRAGVSVDVAKAEKLRDRLIGEQQQWQAKLDAIAGTHVDVNSAATIARAFDALGIRYPRTLKGAPSFTGSWLEAQNNPIADAIKQLRRVEKIRSTFVESYVLDSHVNGKIYGQFHLLRGDKNGTRSGRLSSSTPNLQNIPSRDEELAPLVRGIYIPDPGHLQWRRYDYSQIEYRFLVHFAVGDGADEARARYNKDPDTDYHEMVRGMILALVGLEVQRKPTKTINFGLIYGMGKPKLARSLNLSKQEAEELFAAYHRAIPYAKATMDAAATEAQETGVISTLMGRRSRFDLWEPLNRNYDSDRPVGLPYDEAVRMYGYIKRAYTHKGLNRKLQGSAADMMKFCMWRCWEDGVFAATGVPRLTVHDELDFSDHGGCEEAFRHMHYVLENAMPLRVPVRCTVEIGPNWGAVEEVPSAS